MTQCEILLLFFSKIAELKLKRSDGVKKEKVNLKTTTIIKQLIQNKKEGRIRYTALFRHAKRSMK